MDRRVVTSAVVSEAYSNIKHIFGFDLKEEQISVITAVFNGKDVSAVLPTGYGKSMCYILPPLLLDQLQPDVNHVAIVVSPLLSLMDDQKMQLQRINVKCDVVTHQSDTDIADLIRSESSVIFTTPESLQSNKWRDLFLNETFQKRLTVFAIDEAHCVSDWGEDFRPDYRKISSIRSLVDVPFMALTATATEKVQADIKSHLMLDLDNLATVAVVPDRKNITIVSYETCTQDHEKELEWLLDYLRENDSCTWRKIIIFCRSYSSVYKIWSWLVEEIGEAGYVGGDRASDNRRIEMFHASSDQETKDRIMTNIRHDNKVKIVVSTVAFGMGISIPDIDIVIHWGAPKNTLAYWQEVGRAGRAGQTSIALMYPYKRSLLKNITDPSVLKVVNGDACQRIQILHDLLTSDMNKDDIETKVPCVGNSCEICSCSCCTCCTHCFNKCQCTGKIEPRERFLL